MNDQQDSKKKMKIADIFSKQEKKKSLFDIDRILNVFKPSIQKGRFIIRPEKPSARLVAYRKRRKRKNKLAYASRRTNQLKAA